MSMMMNFKSKVLKHLTTKHPVFFFRNGFTLIETVVAVAVLTTVIIGPVAFLATAFTRTEVSEDKLTALYLAEEGLELVRHVRDNNVLSGSAWNIGLSPYSGVEKLKVDYSGYQIPGSITDDVQAILNFNPSTGTYSYDAGQQSKFTRIMRIDSTTTDQLKVTATVTWQNRLFGVHTVQLQETLYNWQ